MKIRTALALALTMTAFSAASAQFGGYCSQPTAPSAYLSKPGKPLCARMGTGCSEFEISSYRSDVERYYRRLKTYAEEVDTYYEEASAYVKCMANIS